MSLASRSEHSRVVVSTTCDAQVFLEEHLDDIVECLASYFETWDNAGWINADDVIGLGEKGPGVRGPWKVRSFVIGSCGFEIR